MSDIPYSVLCGSLCRNWWACVGCVAYNVLLYMLLLEEWLVYLCIIIIIIIIIKYIYIAQNRAMQLLHRTFMAVITYSFNTCNMLPDKSFL